MTTEEEIGVKKPQAKACLEPPEAGGRKEWFVPWSLQREQSPDNTLISGF